MKIDRFGILIFPDVEELDYIGPWEMLSMWRKQFDGPQQTWIVAQTREPVINAKGLSVNPHLSIDECPQLDVLLVPGGMGTRKEVDNPALIDFIARQAVQAKAMMSVCTGAFMLQRAGLLRGRRATTHWASLDRLRAFDEVTVVEERYVRDGTVWSSAGVSAGADLMLAFIADTVGEEVAGKVQLAAEYFPRSHVYGTVAADPRAPAYVRSGNH